MPETFIIDQQGVIREIITEPKGWTQVDKLKTLTTLLNVTPKTAQPARGGDQAERATKDCS